MSMHNFIRKNRREIDEAIRRTCPNVRRLNGSGREDWIANDDGLYNWARAEGVNV